MPASRKAEAVWSLAGSCGSQKLPIVLRPRFPGDRDHRRDARPRQSSGAGPEVTDSCGPSEGRIMNYAQARPSGGSRCRASVTMSADTFLVLNPARAAERN